MNLQNVRIVTDSSANMLTFQELSFASAPLKIITAQKEYVDDERLDTDRMVRELENYHGKSSTACPSPQDFINAFGDAEYIFCITITSGLSGSYNAACVAKREYEQQFSSRHVCIIDSLSTGPEMQLLAEKLREYVQSGLTFEEACREIAKYQEHTALLFMLESMQNLANNGRVRPIVAKAAGLLGIRVVGKASEKGTLETLDKVRGEKKALAAVVRNMKEMGLKGGKVRIDHCQNEAAAQELTSMLKEECPLVQIEIGCCRGLCSFYAEKGGLMIGFEK